MCPKWCYTVYLVLSAHKVNDTQLKTST